MHKAQSRLTEIKDKVLDLFKSKPTIAWFILAGLLSLGTLLVNPSEPAVEQKSEAPQSPDTYIPKGFVLVPVQIANFESLDSMIGNFAVVSVYRQGPTGELLGTAIKLIRSPINPSTMAVLVPERLGPKFARLDTPVFVIVQNPNTASKSFENRSVLSAGLKIIKETPNEQN